MCSNSIVDDCQLVTITQSGKSRVRLAFAALENGWEMVISGLLDANVWCLDYVRGVRKSEVSAAAIVFK
jgi:hypothetical protein